MKSLFILRGVSGCGKTTLAKEIVGAGNEENIACADDFFYNLGNGEYLWKPELISKAHEYCQEKVKSLLKKVSKKLLWLTHQQENKMSKDI
ncbi:MAG: hypothetical protein HC836_49520 [Richelia sp. RM2_1_2]|nr:hypothetical protein [Richelia sp. RM2_1_2]